MEKSKISVKKAKVERVKLTIIQRSMGILRVVNNQRTTKSVAVLSPYSGFTSKQLVSLTRVELGRVSTYRNESDTSRYQLQFQQ